MVPQAPFPHISMNNISVHPDFDIAEVVWGCCGGFYYPRVQHELQKVSAITSLEEGSM